MKRRSFLAGATAAAATPMLPRLARAADRPFTFCSWGGTLSEMEQKAFIDPFAAAKGIEAVNTSPTEYSRMVAMVEAGKPEWDLVDVGGSDMFFVEARGGLEELDMSKIPNAAALPAEFRAKSGVVTSTGATIIAWSQDAFPDGGPQSWVDFWDVKNFPGPRGLYSEFIYNYEAGLRAAGVALDEIYPYTPEKRDIVYGKIRELKPHVTVWWDSGAQPPQLLSSGELVASSAWSGRIVSARDEGAPIGYTYNDGIAWGNWWVIVKGSPYADLAHEAINFALAPENQRKLPAMRAYGPSIKGATDGLSEEETRDLVMTPEHLPHMVFTDEYESYRSLEDTLESWRELMME